MNNLPHFEEQLKKLQEQHAQLEERTALFLLAYETC